ncbi:MAG: cytochrome c oxidase subunit 3 [Bacteroidetes bacterium]|nr:cytochrome c oxidase subunit 3 [Bacteroidota bacterium]HET6243199.1 cytochrome c oxidase subunit 3 [Bacteroidia bacterium]
MAGAAQTAEGNPWGGGQSPFKISYGKMMMWFFLISDAFTFSALLTAYGFMRHRFEDVWPVAGDVFTHFPFYAGHIELAYVGLMTFILIMSSVTMVLAVEAGHRMDKKNVIKWMILTIIGGFIFVGSQAWEWYHFIHGTEQGALMLADGTVVQFIQDGLKFPGVNGAVVTGAEAAAMIEAGTVVHGANMVVNEYGVPLFANFFFFITGFHGFHVFSGVIINILILTKVIDGEFERKGHYEMVEKTGLYWHFVDLVWVFVFTFFYLL